MGAVVLAPAGCTTTTAKHGCDSSKCATGNACIDDGSGSGETCHLICTAQSECPNGYTCNDGQTGAQGKNWCVANTNFPPEGPGQFSVPCQPSGGEGNNGACDMADNFACYGTSPTDAMSFCTEFGCAQDSDCPGGWWCSTQNVGPNVTSAMATFGKTRALCLPRWYCAPCVTDHDCSPDRDGTQQHCIPDAKGSTYCAPQCQGDANCAADAKCAAQWPVCTPAAGAACASDDDCPIAGDHYQHCDAGKCTPECTSASDCSQGQSCAALSVCSPRAGVCVGDGSFCSPCRSDVDCTNGFCISAAPFSTEHFCSTKATVTTCALDTMNPPGCPAPTSSDNWKAVECSQTPPEQCIALVTLGMASSAQYIPGCWTPSR